MSLLFLSIVLLGFVLYFYGIGIRYFSFIPLLFLIFFFGYYGTTETIKFKGYEIFKKYSLYIAWIITMAGLLGILNFFGINLVHIALGILVINLILWIISYIIKYQDGKLVFQIGFYVSLLFLLIVVLALGGRSLFLTTISLLRVTHLSIIAFFIFIVGLYEHIETYMRYKLGILSLGTIFIVVFDQIKNIYFALTINGIILTGLYYLIYKIFQYHPQTEENKKEISIRRILAGERITMKKKYFNSNITEILYNLITTMPERTKKILEFFNIILVLILMIYYGTHIDNFATMNHIFYRIVIGIFIINIIFLKKLGYHSIIQNLIVFLIVNFAIYVSLFSYFDNDIGAVASRGIFRNFFSAAMIFYVHKVPMIVKILKKTDYIYWIISSIGAMIVNIILLIKTNLPGELIFFLVLVYLGVQSMIIYYAAKYLGKIEIVK